MPTIFFVSDLHGRAGRYQKLFEAVLREKPEAVFIGGDVLPHGWYARETLDFPHRDFINDFLVRNLMLLRQELGAGYPRIFLILGNDDARIEEAAVLDAAARGVWEYIHQRRVGFGRFAIYGYAYVPPTPFRLKDWERYDVSRYTDPDAVSPEEGWRTYPVSEQEIKYMTIKDDLDRMTRNQDMAGSIFLFHSPPYQSKLDLSARAGKMIDHVPLDCYLGSIAVRRFIEARQPLLTLHGHVHESARLSGSWRDRIGRTHCFTAAHDGPELALVRFDPDNLEAANRELV
ncbi:MAG: metallophosphoesterase [Candidatus Aminicenantales bacterium]